MGRLCCPGCAVRAGGGAPGGGAAGAQGPVGVKRLEAWTTRGFLRERWKYFWSRLGKRPAVGRQALRRLPAAPVPQPSPGCGAPEDRGGLVPSNLCSGSLVASISPVAKWAGGPDALLYDEPGSTSSACLLPAHPLAFLPRRVFIIAGRALWICPSWPPFTSRRKLLAMYSGSSTFFPARFTLAADLVIAPGF